MIDPTITAMLILVALLLVVVFFLFWLTWFFSTRIYNVTTLTDLKQPRDWNPHEELRIQNSSSKLRLSSYAGCTFLWVTSGEKNIELVLSRAEQILLKEFLDRATRD